MKVYCLSRIIWYAYLLELISIILILTDDELLNIMFTTNV